MLEEQQKSLYSVAEEDTVTAAVDAAVAHHRAAEDVFNAAVWLIAKDRFCGDVMADTNPERRVLYLRPNRVAKSPGLLARYYIDEADCRVVVDWVKFYDYDDKDAVTPAAYIHKV